VALWATPAVHAVLHRPRPLDGAATLWEPDRPAAGLRRSPIEYPDEVPIVAAQPAPVGTSDSGGHDGRRVKPGLTPQERAILDELERSLDEPARRLLDEPTRRLAEAQRAFEAETLPHRERFRARFAALPPDQRSDGAAA
jgi:hypothetical protein